MYLRLFFSKNNYNYSFGKDPTNKTTEVNLGMDINLDQSSIAQFLDITGTLNFDKYSQSDVSKFISFYLNNKVLILTGTIEAGNNVILDKGCSQLSSVVGGDLEQVFYLQKYIQVGNDYISKIYRFYGIVRSFRRLLLGDNAFNYTFEIEMTEPRYEKLDYINGVLTPKIFTKAPKIQGLKFNIVFPIKFGSGVNNFKITNDGSSQVVPSVFFSNSGQNLRIKTDKGIFSFSLQVSDGKTLILDINNQTAMMDGLDFSGYCSGWEALVLNVGDNNWIIFGDSFSTSSLLTVSFFEKYNSL